MRNSLYSKLAVKNIISNRRIFVPYMLMSIIFIAMFFMLLNLSVQLERSIGKVALSFEPLFVICLTVTALISLIILLYTNGFLIKYRTRELGLYSILGLEKNAIIKVVSLETLFIATITIICGLLGGMVFAKLFYLIITKLINVKSPIGFYIAKDALVKTAALFFLIYLLSILKNYIKLIRLKPLDILREQEKGEKEPKFKFFGTILGLGFIGYGYYLAHNTESYVSSIINFVFAVILVVLGTYLLFINVSIAVLKFLKSRKGFYYKSKNFLSVSNLIYRMKHNAAGLASICILSTMTLVAISTSLSLYASVEEALHKRHPYMFTSTFYEHDKKFNLNTVKKELEQAESDYNIKVTEYNHYKVDYRVSQFVDNKFFMAKNDNIFDFSNKVESQYLLLDDYNAINGTSLQLNDDELFVKTSINLGDTINFVGENGKEQQFNLIKLDNAQLSFINTESIIYKDNLIFILKNEKVTAIDFFSSSYFS
ncbi:MAG: ABC transporter permease [Christensenellaceae bacterium]|nr:ABC transporter permease [Christensenellaceae bacterium]